MGTHVFDKHEDNKVVEGWISSTQSSNLMHLPLRCYDCSITALLDCGASHNFISEALVSKIGGATPIKAKPLPIRLADETTLMSTQSILLPIKFTPYHIYNIPFRVVPTLTHGMLLGMEWFTSFTPIIDWTAHTVTIPVDGKSLELKCVTPHRHPVTLCTAEQFEQMLNNPKCKRKAFAVYIQALEASSKTDAQQSVTGHPELLAESGVLPSTLDNNKTKHMSTNHTSLQENAGKASRWDKLCLEYADVFEKPGFPAERRIKHRIDLLDPTLPVKHHRQYRMSPTELEEVRTQLDDLLAKGWIQPSVSQYNHPILFVPKKDGGIRMCIDYRSLNENTVIDRYPMPRIDDLLDRLSGSTIFSKLDLQSGYHQVAIEPGHEHRTAFQSRFGLYEYLVLPFGLCNAPATFQCLMNDILREKLDIFVVIYLDDILVFSKNPEEHEQHLRWVFEQLRKHSLKVKKSKCAFGVNSVQYLGHVISGKGGAVDPAKTEAIDKCPTPTCVKELQIFLGMCNYYAKFVPSFANIAAPLYTLLHKDNPWQWTKECEIAFDTLKQALTHTPVLRLPDFNEPFEIETDASDIAIGGVLTQHGLPIAYYSKALNTAERNYPVHDRELLAIVQACKRWRPYLAGSRTIVWTDHKPLIHVATQPNLNKRQVRWMEQFADTPIKIQYRPGTAGPVPDALSRLCPTGDVSTILVEPSFLTRLSDAQHNTSDPEMATFISHAHSPNPDFRIVFHGSLPLLYRCRNPSPQLVLPAGSGFRQLLLHECHNSSLVGHLGVRKMVDLLQQRVWWPKMRTDVTAFCKACLTCAKTKDSTIPPPGALQPLPVPPSRFHSWSLDFVTGLPTSHNCNTILTVVDRLTKYVRLIPCWMGDESLSAAAVAQLFISHIVRQFGVPRELVHDRDPRFVSTFWREFWQLLGTKTSASTAYHPQSDGQTERTHRTLGQILRAHCLDKPQTQWYNVLPLVEFAINSTVNASTGFSPFYLVYGANVSLPIDHAIPVPQTSHSTAPELVKHIHKTVKEAQSAMLKAQAAQKQYYDRHHTAVEFTPGDHVLLSTKNLAIAGTRKLEPRFIGPFLILQRIGDQAYKLQLPPSLAAHHPVFHVSQLRMSPPAHLEAPGPIMYPGEDIPHYEVERIVNERAKQYRVRWRGYDSSEDQWIAKSELQQTAPQVVADWIAAKPVVTRSTRRSFPHK